MAHAPASVPTRLPRRIGAGVLGLAGATGLLLGGNEIVGLFYTPIAWTLYILAIDGVIERFRGHSPLTRAPRELALVSLASIGIWYLFEAYNLRLAGWRYVGLPEDRAVRWFGYFWAFATIGPGLLLTRELLEALWPPRARAFRAPAPGGRLPRGVARASVLAGVALLVLPLVVPREPARALWAPVWAGFIFLVDPINAKLGRASIWRDLLSGHRRRLGTLLASGLVCGFLWELWNVHARAKWIYTFPLGGLERVKLFEMPIVGFVGFPPFAVEYFVLTELLAVLWAGTASMGARPTGEGLPDPPASS